MDQRWYKGGEEPEPYPRDKGRQKSEVNTLGLIVFLHNSPELMTRTVLFNRWCVISCGEGHSQEKEQNLHSYRTLHSYQSSKSGGTVKCAPLSTEGLTLHSDFPDSAGCYSPGALRDRAGCSKLRFVFLVDETIERLPCINNIIYSEEIQLSRYGDMLILLVMSQAYETVLEDLDDDFRLPINHRPTENVDLDNVEQASLDTKLTSSNVGFRLLQKMGWKGKGLGKDEQGITEPIKSGMRDPKLGIGKQEEDDYFTAEENIQRRKLDIELEETEEIAKKREVIAEREQKIQTEVKEIRKVFYCELCNKQYKLAVEFEAHLSSYDHNHRKRFKEMREMHGTSSRDDRQKREQQRQEREIAKFAQIADARKQQLQQQEQPEQPGIAVASAATRSATVLADQEQRKALKFGFSSKGGTSKNFVGNAAKKPKVAVASVFGNDSDEE
ncbi:hypothetical protein RHSIM_Rhsim11G0105000 [Rhododendron simsii]|uniref:G-patch domain-containing protein n=1 Tax=Rhododendron simsii TaxID=118357 RepID=A0A834LAZ4_RHOSS|nr:hypothetical protein RHSIM_Rhsim11G0105000 [Rhododendron simsii]